VRLGRPLLLHVLQRGLRKGEADVYRSIGHEVQPGTKSMSSARSPCLTISTIGKGHPRHAACRPAPVPDPGFLRVTVDKNKFGFKYLFVPLENPDNVSLFEPFTA
jgi:hypothetical protein